MDGSPRSYCSLWDAQRRNRFLCYTRTEPGTWNLWSAGGRGEGSVVVRDAGAELQVSAGPGEQNLTLSRLDGPLAAAELKELLFKMADRLAQPEGGSPVSPVKSHQRSTGTSTDFEPQLQLSCAPSAAMKKRLPGASLLNPGTKRARQAIGVTFVDED
ncbi:hypothetical protein EYF80_046611 [Liparis tanakae]|uniref:Protein PAXX n=1 Tax=Liparis tanakae TaxID=230148 RepID=A0A4Z2FQQ5_9TELE|nr:hypothetical protein EYF80_046611 [Liparis tanakae]